MNEQLSKRTVKPVRVASLRAAFELRENGFVYVQSTEPPGHYSVRVTDRLDFWAHQTPDRIFLAQRSPTGAERNITYSDACIRVKRLAAGLLREGLSTSRPVIILSGNSIEHALIALAAMYVGIPYAPVAPAYSLAVRDFSALGEVWRNLEPGMVFVEEGPPFTRALKAMPLAGRCQYRRPGSIDDG